MVPEMKTNEAAAFVISAKMAKALADPSRARIMMELSVRPMSPSQFVEKVGGELTRVSSCFRQLAEWDFIEVIEKRSGGQRRGAIEHVYRSIQRAHFDTSTWEGLSPGHKDAFSSSILESYIARIREAIEARTFDQELDRHLSWDGIPLDRTAWTELNARLDEILDWLPALALEAAERMAKTGEEPIPTTVGMAAFRSPVSARVAAQPPRQPQNFTADPEAVPFAISAKMAKVVANKWRSRILMELRIRPLGPTQFIKRVGGGESYIHLCFRQLAKWGYIEVIEIRTGGSRRGGKEKIYRLKQRAYFDTQTWERLPRFLRDEFSASILQSYFARVTEAINAGTFDAEPDRHLSWDGIALDRVAWTELIRRLDEVLDWLPVLEGDAARRMARTGERPIPTTVGLAAFRVPKTSEIPAKPDSRTEKRPSLRHME